MGRHKSPYSLIQRPNGYWYFKIEGWTNYKSTGSRKESDAKRAVALTLREQKQEARTGLTFGQYATPFYIWETCPHVRKLLDEGKAITRRYCRMQRSWLVRYVLGDTEKKIESDELAGLPLTKITRADIMDFRARLMAKLGDRRNTVNKAMAAVKTIFKEALYREDIDRDPTAGVGNVKENRKEPGTFSKEELKELFPAEGFGPWQGILDYAVFRVAADLGLRMGEILALRWRHVDFVKKVVDVVEAWKDVDELGKPKWERTRRVPLPDKTAAVLKAYKDGKGEKVVRFRAVDDLVFSNVDGDRLGQTWWMKHFRAAMKKAKIETVTRGLKPHSFRHTLNTNLLDAGVDPAKVRAWLGWSNARTQDLYTHWKPEMLREGADLVDRLYGM
jgi:integrase